MEKYLSGKELLERWNIQGFQLLEIIRDGLQPYTKLGFKILDKGQVTHERKEALADILRDLKIEQGAFNTQFVGGVPGRGRIIPKLTDDELEAKARQQFEKQPHDTPVIPAGCVVEDLSAPVDEKDAALKIKKAMGYQFRLSDVDESEESRGIIPEITEQKEFDTPQKERERHIDKKTKASSVVDPSSFVISENDNLKWSDIRVALINETEMRFHPKGGHAIVRSYDQLGFKDNRNGKPVSSWAVLINALNRESLIPYHNNTRTKVEKTTQELRKKFKALFPNIEGDPVPHDKSSQSYKIAFHIQRLE